MRLKVPERFARVLSAPRRALARLARSRPAEAIRQELTWCEATRAIEGRSTNRALVALDVAISSARFLVCLIRGHDLIDGDPGDPEVGPRPDIHCQRCGSSW